jgi:hypothetical protein
LSCPDYFSDSLWKRNSPKLGTHKKGPEPLSEVALALARN